MARQILIVDDSTSIRNSMHHVLSNEGYEVIIAANGKEALSVIRPETELIITDINMPEMDGITFISKVRSGAAPHKTVPIIILTTESQSDLKQKGKEAGATAWMVKPFKSEDITSVIKRILG